MDAKSKSVVLSVPADEFRSLPVPFSSGPDGSKPKLGSCFINAAALPIELKNWMKVNPRVPALSDKDELKGQVARAMIETLDTEPELFALKNQGIWILAEKVVHKKQEGGKGLVEITLSDPNHHGLVNGGHTAHVIFQYLRENGPDELADAYVRLHILEGVESTQLVLDLAEGLNTSMQVDDPSLQNLAGAFDGIKSAMKGLPGADQISYRQGDRGEIDVRQVITMMALFDLNSFPDRKKHPNTLFGQKKGVLEAFVQDAEAPDSIFKKILPALPEILKLSDRIAQLAFERHANRLGRMKLSNAKNNNRAGSPKHKSTPAHFAGGKIGGKFHLGWLYPMLASFRANVSREAWEKGEFKWHIDNDELLEAVIDEMVDIIIDVHQEHKGKPAEVGRKDTAYRLCYSAVTMELASRGKLNAA